MRGLVSQTETEQSEPSMAEGEEQEEPASSPRGKPKALAPVEDDSGDRTDSGEITVDSLPAGGMLQAMQETAPVKQVAPPPVGSGKDAGARAARDERDKRVQQAAVSGHDLEAEKKLAAGVFMHSNEEAPTDWKDTTKAERKWRAMTMVDGKNKHLGYFEVCHYMPQPLVELYGDCMVVLKVS